MKIRNLFKMAALLFTLVFSAACVETISDDGGKTDGTGNPNVVFTASLAENSVGTDKASFNVSHDGVKYDTYYAFCIKSDDVTSVDQAITQKTRELIDAGNLSSKLRMGNKALIYQEGLSSNTSYKFIVFGLNKDGSTYGAAATADFKTLKAEARFNVSVKSKTAESATVEVSFNDGDESTRYICFNTSDLTTDINELAEEAAKSETQYSDNPKTFEFTSLTASTGYRVIVAGVAEGDEVYGATATKYTTESEETKEDWTFTLGDAEYDSENYMLLQSIDISGTKGKKILPIAITEELKGLLDKNNIPVTTYLDKTVADYYGYCQANGISWTNVYMTGDGTWQEPVPAGVRFYMYAVEVTDEGKTTGTYAGSALLTAVDINETASADYENWLGEWTITSAGSANTHNVTIAKSVVNREYAITGVQYTNKDVNFDFAPVKAIFNSEDNSIEFIAEQYGITIELEDNKGQTFDASLYFLGSFLNNGGKGVVTGSGYSIAKCAYGENTQIQGLELKLQGGSVTLTGMEYIGVRTDNGNPYLLEKNGIAFPATMVKKSTSAQSHATAPASFKNKGFGWRFAKQNNFSYRKLSGMAFYTDRM